VGHDPEKFGNLCRRVTKTFDSISHSAISEALAGLDIPDSIYNWLVEYLKGRKHFTSFTGQISSVAVINASVVQGSVVGPPKFIIRTADLLPVSSLNRLLKYADDSYLLIGSRNACSAQDEISHITTWATRKHLHLNPSKTGRW